MTTTTELIVSSTQEPPRSEAGKRVTEAEYWQYYYRHPDFNYEWNNGKLEEKGVSDYATVLVYRWFLSLLEHYLAVQPVANLTLLEMGFRLKLPRRTTIRKPDLAVVHYDNPVPLTWEDESYHGIFDICIEALSDSKPSELRRDLIVKKGEYAQVGVKEYFLLYAHAQPIEFYRLNANGVYEPIPRREGEIISSQVLPGFQFRLTDLFYRPSIEELIEDPVYQGFVLPGYQQAKQQAQLEAQRAQQAELKMLREAQRAQREALRAQQAEQQIELEAQRAQQAEQRVKKESLRAQQAEQRATMAEEEIARLQAVLAQMKNEG